MTTKITISLPDELAGMLDEMLAETGGPPTDAERRSADRALGLAAGRSRR